MNHANFKKALLAAILMTAAALAGPKTHAGTPVTASCMAESPVDGSVWIGSNGQGLFRLGRNGRQVVYRAEEGRIPSNSIKTLFFDADNTLWILDTEGQFTVYSTIEGFQKAEGMAAVVDCAIYDKQKDCIYFSSGKSLKSYKKVNTETQELAALPTPAKSLKMAENEGNFLWVFCEKGVLKVGLDGSTQLWEEAPKVLDLLPFEFETNQPSSAVKEGKSTPLWLIILGIVLALLTGYTAGILLKKKDPVTPEVHTPAVPVIKPAEKPVDPKIQTAPVLAPKPEQHTAPAVTERKSTQAAEEPQQSQELKKAPQTAPEIKEVPEQEAEPRQPDPVTAIKTPEKSTESSLKGGAFTKRVYSLIKANLSDPDFDVESIAALTGISRIHVNRKLRAEGAPAPSAIIKEVRMKHAARLIRQGKMGISQISSVCGFRTPSYFATAFKEFYGVSPSEFTEEQQG